MSDSTTNLVFVEDGTIYTSAQQVAEMFEKQHNHIMRDIANLSNSGQIADRGFFVATTYIDTRNRVQPSYSMTRDGFALLAMSFTGEKALAFKLDFIGAFNAMEAKLADRASVPAIIPAKAAKPSRAVVGAKPSGAYLRELRKLGEYARETLGLSQSSVQCLMASSLQSVGIEMPMPVIPTRPSFTSSDLAEKYDLHPTVFGKQVKHLKIDEHGETRLIVTSLGRQVEQFVWNEVGAAAVAEFMAARDRRIAAITSDD